MTERIPAYHSMLPLPRMYVEIMLSFLLDNHSLHLASCFLLERECTPLPTPQGRSRLPGK